MTSSLSATGSYTDLAAIPALAPPPGVSSDFRNPPSHAENLRITVGVCLPIMIVIVGVRIYTKLCIKRTWGTEDCMSRNVDITVHEKPYS